ncbi:MAG: TolB family protein [Actinomycetales bacterium]
MPAPARLMAAVACAGLLAGCTSHASSRPNPAATPRAVGVIAFVRHEPASDPRGQIFLERADGRDARPVVRSDADDESPALSPDSRHVAFTRRTASQPDQIFLVGVDGSGLRQVTPSGCPDRCGAAVDSAAWSPDGASLAFTRTVFHGNDPMPVRAEIWVVDIATASAHRVTRGSAARVGDRLRSQDGYAGWSPDGRRILFVHEEHATPAGLSQYAVMTIALDGTDLRPVTPNDVNAGQPVWAPDGSLIAFQSPPDDEGVTKALYTIRPDGTGMTSLTSTLDSNDSAYPSWSPDSRLIAFSHVREGSSGGADLYVVSRDGGDPHPILRTGPAETTPSWGR